MFTNKPCSSLFADKLEHFAAQTQTETESEFETERIDMHERSQVSNVCKRQRDDTGVRCRDPEGELEEGLKLLLLMCSS